MCYVCDATVDVDSLTSRKYECIDCHNIFKGIGKRVKCPSCRSSNVEKIG